MRNARAAQIEIQIATARRGVPHARMIRQWAAAAMPSGNYALCIRIVGNAESRKLNRQWRGKDKPTNVLSFPYSELLTSGQLPVASNLVLGDLAICAPVVAREAREQGKTLNAHWAHMVVHGVLHLLGYDHMTTRDAKRMESYEVVLLGHFGLADPYIKRQ